MKATITKILIVLLTFQLLAVGSWTVPAANADGAEIAAFADPNLRQAIAEWLGKSVTDTVYKSDIEGKLASTSYKALELPNRGIVNLAGMEIFNGTALETLNLSRNKISDLTPLTEFTSLTYLDVSQNPIADISSLSNMTGMTQLFLSGTRIKNLDALQNMVDLFNLQASQTLISDVSGIKNLTKMMSLNLQSNPLYDITPLSNLSNIKMLNLDMTFLNVWSGANKDVLDTMPAPWMKVTTPQVRYGYIEGTSFGTVFAIPVGSTSLPRYGFLASNDGVSWKNPSGFYQGFYDEYSAVPSTFISIDSSIATVGPSGQITGVASGTTQVITRLFGWGSNYTEHIFSVVVTGGTVTPTPTVAPIETPSPTPTAPPTTARPMPTPSATSKPVPSPTPIVTSTPSEVVLPVTPEPTPESTMEPEETSTPHPTAAATPTPGLTVTVQPTPTPTQVAVETPPPSLEATTPPKLIGTVTGTVVDAKGNPMPNVLVELHSLPRITMTDELGKYSFQNVELGEHTILLKTESLQLIGTISVKVEDTIRNAARTGLQLTQAKLTQVVDFIVTPPALEQENSLPLVTLESTPEPIFPKQVAIPAQPPTLDHQTEQPSPTSPETTPTPIPIVHEEPNQVPQPEQLETSPKLKIGFPVVVGGIIAATVGGLWILLIFRRRRTIRVEFYAAEKYLTGMRIKIPQRPDVRIPVFRMNLPTGMVTLKISKEDIPKLVGRQLLIENAGRTLHIYLVVEADAESGLSIDFVL